MDPNADLSLILSKYRDAFGASVPPAFASFLFQGPASGYHAALGYKRAGEDALFLEVYLDGPIEREVSRALGRTIERKNIVEIGSFAAANGLAMLGLWGAAANDLGGSSEVAVATLTQPLRHIFRRIGIPVHEICPADPARLGEAAEGWGSYYETNPMVCAGTIAEGQEALWAFLQCRRRVAAA